MPTISACVGMMLVVSVSNAIRLQAESASRQACNFSLLSTVIVLNSSLPIWSSSDCFSAKSTSCLALERLGCSFFSMVCKRWVSVRNSNLWKRSSTASGLKREISAWARSSLTSRSVRMRARSRLRYAESLPARSNSAVRPPISSKWA